MRALVVGGIVLAALTLAGLASVAAASPSRLSRTLFLRPADHARWTRLDCSAEVSGYPYFNCAALGGRYGVTFGTRRVMVIDERSGRVVWSGDQ